MTRENTQHKSEIFIRSREVASKNERIKQQEKDVEEWITRSEGNGWFICLILLYLIYIQTYLFFLFYLLAYMQQLRVAEKAYLDLQSRFKQHIELKSEFDQMYVFVIIAIVIILCFLAAAFFL
jgi:hypothetical protein